MSRDAAELSLMEVVALLASRQLSTRELLAACRARIDSLDSRVKAFVLVSPDQADAAARAADDARARGLPIHPLAGIPVAVKDILMTRGVPTGAGSQVFAEWTPETDAAAWRKLQEIGAGLLGKVTTHEFAFGTSSGSTANPWDLSRAPGGSSGGSAAALAARMAPAALGSDTAGSLRIPAAACGVCTLRPARGRVSRIGVVPLSPTFDSVGALARRMADVGLLMNVLAGFDPEDPGSRSEPAPLYPTTGSSLAGRRLGVPTDLTWSRLDPQIEEICRGVIADLESEGVAVVEVPSPPIADDVLADDGVFDVISESEARAIHDLLVRDPNHRSRYTAQVLERVLRGEAITEQQVSQAHRLRREWRTYWRSTVDDLRLDAFVQPTLDRPPPPQGSEEPPIRLSVPWSVADFAATSLPVGLDHRGLPVGISLVAPPEREADLLAMAITLDDMYGFWERMPPLDYLSPSLD